MPRRKLVVLFTDLVGSTSHRVALGDDVADGMRRDHDDIVRAATQLHGGVWVKSTGDGALITFRSAASALQAAAVIQREVTARIGEHAFEVRIGATAGEVAVEDDCDVFGMPVNTAARLCDAAVAGQVLVSDEVVALAGSDNPLATIAVGALDLKGLGAAVDAHAVIWSDTAPTHLKDTVARAGAGESSIPETVTSFVGRQAELGELHELVKEHRLVTLLGPGGMGKTRLAIALSTELHDQFPDGVWFVDLSVVTDERAFSTQVLKTLGVADSGEGSFDQLIRYVSQRRALLVIDNCEHLIATAAEVVHGLLGGAPGVRIVTTTRERLGVPGEYAWEIPAIGTADAGDDGIRLFTQRAEAAGSHLSEADRDDVVALCRLLDGMPLAIELAASRCRSVSPGRVLERLRERPDQALGSSRTGPDRQRSLDGLVTWSVDLLDERERALFTRLAIFDGPFPAEAAEAVCTDELVDAFDVIDLLSALVEKSLVATTSNHDGPLWYRMLFTIRTYAHDLLGDDHAALDRRLLAWLTEHVRELETRLRSPDQVAAHHEFTGIHPLLNRALQANAEDGLDDLRRDLADVASYWLWFAGHHREAIVLIAPMLDAGDPAVRARLHAWQALHARALGRPDGEHLDAADALVDALVDGRLDGNEFDEVTLLRVASAREAYDADRSDAELHRATATGCADLAMDFHLRVLTALRSSASADPDERWDRSLAAAAAAAEELGDPKSLYEVAIMTSWEATVSHRMDEAVALAERAVAAARACPIEGFEVTARIFVASSRQRLPDAASRALALDEAFDALGDALRLDLPHLVNAASGACAITLMTLERFDEAVAIVEAHPTGGFDPRDRFTSINLHHVGRHADAVAVMRRWLAGEEVGDMRLMWPAPYAIWSLGAIADAVALARCSSVANAFYLDTSDQIALERLIARSRPLLSAEELATEIARGEAMTLAEGAALTRRLLAEPSVA